MSRRQTVTESQLSGARRVLEHLQEDIPAEFIGLISTSGVSILTLEPSGLIDSDVLASLAASSFLATQQLALIMNETEFTVMFHEGSGLNIHIAMVSEQVLLVVCFRKAADLGKVRLISKRVLGSLASVLEAGRDDDGTRKSDRKAGDG